jgi:hypothetical protein
VPISVILGNAIIFIVIGILREDPLSTDLLDVFFPKSPIIGGMIAPIEFQILKENGTLLDKPPFLALKRCVINIIIFHHPYAPVILVV